MRKIRKGDEVIVLRGRDHGRKGKVLSVDGDKAIVDNINVVKRHSRRQANNLHGGITDKSAPLPLSALALVSKKDGKAVRVRFETRETAGKVRKVRVATRTNEVFE